MPHLLLDPYPNHTVACSESGRTSCEDGVLMRTNAPLGNVSDMRLGSRVDIVSQKFMGKLLTISTL